MKGPAWHIEGSWPRAGPAPLLRHGPSTPAGCASRCPCTIALAWSSATWPASPLGQPWCTPRVRLGMAGGGWVGVICSEGWAGVGFWLGLVWEGLGWGSCQSEITVGGLLRRWPRKRCSAQLSRQPAVHARCAALPQAPLMKTLPLQSPSAPRPRWQLWRVSGAPPCTASPPCSSRCWRCPGGGGGR